MIRNGYTMEVGPRDYVFKRRVFWGRGAARERAIAAGEKTARKLGERRFYITDSVSARTETFEVTRDSWVRISGGVW